MKKIIFASLCSCLFLIFSCKKDEYIPPPPPDTSCKAVVPTDSLIKVYPSNNFVSISIFDYKPYAISIVEKSTQKVVVEGIKPAFSPNIGYTMKGLNASSDYEVIIAGYCEDSKTITKDVKKRIFRTLDDCALPAPTNFKIVEQKDNLLTLQWDKVPNANRYYLNVIDAKLQKNIAGSPITIVVDSTKSKIDYNFYLPSGVTFEFQLFASCKSGVLSKNITSVTTQPSPQLIFDDAVTKTKFPFIKAGCDLRPLKFENPIASGKYLDSLFFKTATQTWKQVDFRFEQVGNPNNFYELSLLATRENGVTKIYYNDGECTLNKKANRNYDMFELPIPNYGGTGVRVDKNKYYPSIPNGYVLYIATNE